MRKILRSALRALNTPVVMFGLLMFHSSAGLAEQAKLAESRLLAQAYAQQLQTALLDALGSKGTAGAILVCRDLAPAIASEFSGMSVAIVGRVRFGFRYRGSAPALWQRQVLRTLQVRTSNPEDRLESFADDANGVRYMAGIRLKPMCLACHGRDIAEDVKQQLARDYPFDRATGYEVGDLRGAFSVIWPATAEDVQQ